jgi:hypothetical protein
MGIDILVYRGLERMPDHEFTDQCYKAGEFDHFVIKGDHQKLGLIDGCYLPEQWYYTSICNWSGYSHWCEHLALMAHGVDANTVWRNPESHPAFRELIGFTDHGDLGAEVCRKLAGDFRDNLEKAEAYSQKLGEDDFPDWWIFLYKKFLRAFDFASERGCVLSY